MRDFLKLALVLLGVCLVLAIKDVGAANATSNGCGPKVLGSIDKELKAVGEGNLIQCCDQHDICYGTCTPGQDQKYCDNQFNQCLTTQCSNTYPNTKTLSLKLKSDACKASAKTMYTLVKDFGKLFYTGCTTKKNILSKLFKS